MNRNRLRQYGSLALAALLSASVIGCSNSSNDSGQASATPAPETAATVSPSNSATASASGSAAAPADAAVYFSDRDLRQSADLAGAATISLASHQDVTLSADGVYVLSGSASNATIIVDAPKDAKVQIVLNGVSITNADAPAIYVKEADKVFVTLTDSENQLSVTGNYVPDGSTKLDAVIFSRADLTLNGTGSLAITSAQGNGVSSKDDLKITGGTYTIESGEDALEANDAILIHDGTITIETDKDGLNSVNDEDETRGYIYIGGGSLTITAVDDAIRGNRFVQIDGGTIHVTTSEEGIEATQIRINGGEITIFAKDDGINAAEKVNAEVLIEVNGGTVDVTVGQGDTDAFDSNGDIRIQGGTIHVQARSAFDADGKVDWTGGEITVNGEKITEIKVSRGGPGPRRR